MSPANTVAVPPHLSAEQSARMDVMSEECQVVGVHEGCPLVRLAGGEIALLERDGRLAPARRRLAPVAPRAEAVGI